MDKRRKALEKTMQNPIKPMSKDMAKQKFINSYRKASPEHHDLLVTNILNTIQKAPTERGRNALKGRWKKAIEWHQEMALNKRNGMIYESKKNNKETKYKSGPAELSDDLIKKKRKEFASWDRKKHLKQAKEHNEGAKHWFKNGVDSVAAHKQLLWAQFHRDEAKRKTTLLDPRRLFNEEKTNDELDQEYIDSIHKAIKVHHNSPPDHEIHLTNEDGEKYKFILTIDHMADFSKGRVSFNSPLGKAFMKNKNNSHFDVVGAARSKPYRYYINSYRELPKEDRLKTLNNHLSRMHELIADRKAHEAKNPQDSITENVEVWDHDHKVNTYNNFPDAEAHAIEASKKEFGNHKTGGRFMHVRQIHGRGKVTTHSYFGGVPVATVVKVNNKVTGEGRMHRTLTMPRLGLHHGERFAASGGAKGVRNVYEAYADIYAKNVLGIENLDEVVFAKNTGYSGKQPTNYSDHKLEIQNYIDFHHFNEIVPNHSHKEWISHVVHGDGTIKTIKTLKKYKLDEGDVIKPNIKQWKGPPKQTSDGLPRITIPNKKPIPKGVMDQIAAEVKKRGTKPKFSKKHYEHSAKMISFINDDKERENQIRNHIFVYQEDNPRFDRDKFRQFIDNLRNPKVIKETVVTDSGTTPEGHRYSITKSGFGAAAKYILSLHRNGVKEPLVKSYPSKDHARDALRKHFSFNVVTESSKDYHLGVFREHVLRYNRAKEAKDFFSAAQHKMNAIEYWRAYIGGKNSNPPPEELYEEPLSSIATWGAGVVGGAILSKLALNTIFGDKEKIAAERHAKTHKELEALRKDTEEAKNNAARAASAAYAIHSNNYYGALTGKRPPEPPAPVAPRGSQLSPNNLKWKNNNFKDNHYGDPIYDKNYSSIFEEDEEEKKPIPFKKKKKGYGRDRADWALPPSSDNDIKLDTPEDRIVPFKK